MLPLEAPLRLIGDMADFKLYYSLYVYNVFICIVTWKFSVNKFISSKIEEGYNISNGKGNSLRKKVRVWVELDSLFPL